MRIYFFNLIRAIYLSLILAYFCENFYDDGKYKKIYRPLLDPFLCIYSGSNLCIYGWRWVFFDGIALHYDFLRQSDGPDVIHVIP